MGKLFGFIIIIAIVLGATGFFLNSYYNNELDRSLYQGEQPLTFEIASGSAPTEIATRLNDEGIDVDENVFRIYLRQTGYGDELKAGIFQIPAGTNLVQLVDIFREATPALGVRVTFPEGLRLEQKAERLEAAFASGDGQTSVTAANFLELTENPDQINFSSAELREYIYTRKPAAAGLEGFLYPDTYEFRTTATTSEVIEEILLNFRVKTSSLPLETSGRSFFENLTLASIIEKESITVEERPLISSVFSNRLAINMALQSDATVNYVTRADNPRPTFAELAVDSPYNTYKYPGLPPGPINSPRLQSLEAAMNPAETGYYYFLHQQDGSGQIRLAATFAEHNENIRRYLD